jgi:hypothetical protein
LTLFCAVVTVFCLQTVAFAAKVPPTIDQIEGVYAAKDKGVWYDFADGSAHKYSETVTWAITKTSATTVEVDIEPWGWIFEAYCVNGILVMASGDPADSPSTEMGVGLVLFSGSAGKVKMKGQLGYDALYDDWCESDAFSGKMILAGPPPMPRPSATADEGALASADDVEDPGEPDILEAGEALRGATPPPGIDDLVGTYAAKAQSTMYQPSTGLSEKGGGTDTWVVTKDDDFTLNIHSVDMDTKAHYAFGVLMIAEVQDDSAVTGEAMFAIGLVKGKPGKLSMKGTSLSVTDLYGVDDEVETAKLSAKQVAP